MEALKKLVIRHSIVVLFVVGILFQFINCNNSSTTSNVGYGKSFFYENCAICHYRKYDGLDSTPGLLTLNSYDSLTLVGKLRGINLDTIHSAILHPLKYSDKEIVSVCKYIKGYFKPQY